MESSVGRRRRISLDAADLDEAGRIAWLLWLRFALDAAGVEGAIDTAVDMPSPEPDETFVFLTGSGLLSPRLLRRFPRIHIRPSRPPCRVEHELYWQAASSRSLEHLLDACRTGDDDLDRALLDWRGQIEPFVPRVALLTSIFDGDAFLDGFLENSAALKGYAECEHFLVRAGSPGQEALALRTHVGRHASAVYINLAKDPGLYEVWNLCARLATSPLLSNANLDDRRAPGHLETLATRLETHPEADVASAALRVTFVPHLSWDASGDCPVWYGEADLREYAVSDLIRITERGRGPHNIPHCMPLWRRSLHAFHGGFCECDFGPCADWAFWLRVGVSGTRFAHVPEPLGLYLKDQGSYWQRGARGNDPNARVLRAYSGGGAEPVASSEMLVSTTPRARELAWLRECAACGAWLPLVVGLLNLAWRLCGERQHDAAREAVAAYARHYLGVPDLFAWLAIDHRSALAPASTLEAAREALTELSHRRAAESLVSAGADRVARGGRVIAGAWFDLHRQTGDVRGLLGVALLRRLQGDLAAERYLLRAAQVQTGAEFWSRIQDVYRFRVPLAELCADLDGPGPCGAREAERFARSVIHFYPDYRRGNPYQRLLYQRVIAAGARVEPVESPDAIMALEPEPGRDNVIHIHWLQEFLKGVDRLDVPMLACRFTEILRRARARGFRIHWTVHNALNHESANPEAECRLRHHLARLVDCVYVHHPMVPSLLEWWPAGVPARLVEHGPLPVSSAGGENREGIRARLGMAADTTLLVSAGIVRDYKALDRCVPVIRERMETDPRLHFAVVGRIVSPAARQALATLPPERVTVQDEMLPPEAFDQWLRAADYCLLSYRAILTSGALFHAFSLGVPVIAPRLGTLPAYVVEGWNGFTYDGAPELRAVLDRATAASRAYRAALADNAERTASSLEWRFC